jgi:uncharacterized protein
MHFLRVLLLGFIVVLPQEAAAQQEDILRLFGGVIRSGIAAATQADWERLPNSELACIDRALGERGSSINNLVRQGISPSDGKIAGVRGGCRDQAASGGPSFDCRRATYPDEVTICGDPELARLDRLIGGGYQVLVDRYGEAPARGIAAPLLASRRACGSDAGCIKNAQISTIRELQRRGAPITYAEPAPSVDSPYVVDGLRLGGRVAIGSPSYLEYRCNPSEQFTGLTWCQRRRQDAAPRGPYISTTTILHSADGTALYVNRYLEPAFFAGNEALDDVRRLAIKYGEPRYMTAPPVANAPRTLMVSWGGVELHPLDRARLDDLAAGREVRAGILIDHIGNFQRSAAIGLPVYRVTGGPGYIWAASWDQAGRGTLRFLTIDPSKLGSSVPVHPDVASNAAAQRPNEPSLAPNESSLNASPASSPASPAPARTAEPPPPATTNLPPAENASSVLGRVPPTPSPQPDRFLSQADPSNSVQKAEAPAAVATREPAPPVASSAPAKTDAARDRALPASSRPEPPTALSQAPAPIGTAPRSEVGSSSPAAATPVDREPGAKGSAVESRAEPRVVGPPIAIRPTVKEASGGNTLQWALVAAIVVLLAAVGFLLFDRRKRTGLAFDPTISPASTPAESAAAKDVVVELADVKSEDPEEPKLEPVLMEEPPPLPVGLPNPSTTSSDTKPDGGAIAPAAIVAGPPRSSYPGPSSSIVEHEHFGIGLLAGLVTLCALMTPAIGGAGLLPLAIAVYLLPTIIAFKVRHHYAGWLALINIVFGATVLGWFGFFVWALTGPRKSALDAMGQPSALGLSKTASSDPALQMSDNELRSGWKMPVVQAEIFSFGDEGPAVESGDAVKVFFKNPVVGIWRTGSASSNSHCVRYNAFTQIRCVAKIGAESKLRVGRTLGRTALTGIGAAILTGRSNALGAAFLDYRFAGDEKDEVVAALIVFSDYSSVVIQSESEEFDKFCALLPAHVLSDEDAAKTAEEIDRIKRMAEDGPRVLDEMQEQIAKTKQGIAKFDEQAKSGTTFAERDEGRTGLAQAEARLIDELAVLNAVGRLIRLAGGRELPDRRIA